MLLIPELVLLVLEDELLVLRCFKGDRDLFPENSHYHTQIISVHTKETELIINNVIMYKLKNNNYYNKYTVSFI